MTVGQIFTLPVLGELVCSVKKRFQTDDVSAMTVNGVFSSINKDTFLDQLIGVSLIKECCQYPSDN